MYELLKLPYLFQDLEPYIDTHTMGLHYHKHQQGYLNKLNDLLMKSNYDYRYTISDTATIYGYANSTAQAYAEKYSRNFVAITE